MWFSLIILPHGDFVFNVQWTCHQFLFCWSSFWKNIITRNLMHVLDGPLKVSQDDLRPIKTSQDLSRPFKKTQVLDFSRPLKTSQDMIKIGSGLFGLFVLELELMYQMSYWGVPSLRLRPSHGSAWTSYELRFVFVKSPVFIWSIGYIRMFFPNCPPAYPMSNRCSDVKCKQS